MPSGMKPRGDKHHGILVLVMGQQNTLEGHLKIQPFKYIPEDLFSFIDSNLFLSHFSHWIYPSAIMYQVYSSYL